VNKKSLRNGLKWTFIDYLLNKGLYFITTVYLARVLGPKDFGIFGILALFTLIANTLIDSGLSNSLLRQDQISQKDFDTIFVTNILFSLILYTFTYFLSPYIATTFHQPDLDLVLKIYCLSFIISSLRVVQNTYLLNKLEFRKITILNIPGNILGAIIAIYFALNNFGYWSLLILYLSNQFLTTIIYWIFVGWKPRFRFNYLVFKIHFKFGYKLLLASQINIIFDNINSLFIAGRYPIATLGYYERANTFNFYPVSIISSVIQKISLPYFSKILDNKEDLKKKYLKLFTSSFFITLIIFLFLNISIDKIIEVFLGKNWLPMTLFFQLLSINYLLYPIHALNLNILNLFGRSDLFLYIEIIKKIFLSVILLFSFKFGILGLIVGNIFVSILSFFINAYHSAKYIDIGISTQIKNLYSTLFFSIFIALLFLTIRQLFINNNAILFLFLYTASIVFIFLVIVKYNIFNFNSKYLSINPS